MKHLLVGLSLVLGVFFISPVPVAHAWSWSSFFDGHGEHNHDGGSDSYWSHGGSVPELDPSAAGSAIVLLLGGVAYVLSRRRDDKDVA